MKNVPTLLVKIVLKLLGLKAVATYGGIHEKKNIGSGTYISWTAILITSEKKTQAIMKTNKSLKHLEILIKNNRCYL